MIDVRSTGEVVQLHARARSQVPFDRLEVLANGKVIAVSEASGTPADAVVELDWTVGAGCWLAARCVGSRLLPQGNANQKVFAHASPVYVQVASRSKRPDPIAVKTLAGYLDGTLEWVRTAARCSTERQRDRLAHVFLTALDKLKEQFVTDENG